MNRRSRMCHVAALCAPLVALLLAFGASAGAAVDAAATGSPLDAWSAAEREVLRSLQLDALPKASADPSNAYESLPAAVTLGRKIFFDPRFSANGQISCASCHLPQQQFQDGRPLAQGMAAGSRRTMPVVESGRGPWQFWDGRKDSLWSQALGPMEDAREHGGDRTAYASLLEKYYRADYIAVFKHMPALGGLPQHAGPFGDAATLRAWQQLDPERRRAVSLVFANMGKAIAAYEKTLHHGDSRLDEYIAATLRQDPAAAQKLSVDEKRGLRLFIGKAQCVSCHAGALFSDQHFHNTGVPPRDAGHPDPGRSGAIKTLLEDEFNCLGPYSDAAPGQCQELAFIAAGDARMLGAFKTPGLRNVAGRPPYMHAGQIADLDGVLRHYAAAPRAVLGRSERTPLTLSENDIADLVKFLATLSGPVSER